MEPERHAPTAILPCRCARSETGGVPAEQSLCRQQRIIFFSGIEHHLDDALDVTIGRRERADIHPQPARERGAHLIAIEHLAFNLARLEHLLGQVVEARFGAQQEAERLHPAYQPPC